MSTPSVLYEIDEQGLRSWGELVGDIHVVGNSGEIRCRDTYIDSWIACLEEGATALISKDHAVVEIPEERDPLSFERRRGGALTVRYANSAAVFSSVHALEAALVAAAKSLVDRANALKLDRNGAFVNEVERIAARQL